MKGNRNNVIRAVADFLSGVSRYDSRDDVNSAPAKVRRATEAKKSLGQHDPKTFRFEDGTVANRDDYNLPASGNWSKKTAMPRPPVKKVMASGSKALPRVKKAI